MTESMSETKSDFSPVVKMSPDKSKEEFTLEKENENVTTVEIEQKEQNVVLQPGIQQAPLSCGDEEVIVNITRNGCAVSGGKGVDLTDVECALEKENENVTTVEIEPKEQNVVLQPGIQQAPLSCGSDEDVIVNITGNGCAVSGGKGVENAFVDLTDIESTCSSSFGDTGSGLDTGSGSDSDVESPMFSDRREPPRLRTKRLTAHWRKFIDPLVWRSKWIELQLRKLNSLAMKYEKEIAAYDEKQQRELLKYAVDGFDVKSVPKSDGIQSHKIMKRKKRRRAEECNLSSYVSSHNIFSYYENKNHCPENRNHSPHACLENVCGDVMSNADNPEEFELSDMQSSSVDHEDNDKSFFDMIQKVEQVLLHVENLKARIDNVMNENPGKFCSVTQSSTIGPSDGFNHAGQNSASLAGNENPYPVSFVHASSQHKSEFYLEDPLPTENTLSTRNGITPFNETAKKPRFEFPRENTKGKVNQAPKKELHGFENVRNQHAELSKKRKRSQLVEKSKESDEEPKSIRFGHR